MRGRTALYGPRHLQQLVAIKRRQAEGRSLAEIQVEFSWITPEALREVSRVPEPLLDNGNDHPAHSSRARFWVQPPAPRAAAPSARPATTTTHPVAAVALGDGVILLVPHSVGDRDRDDIATAAAPLLALLAARGLTDGSSS
jgi:hypothetical protein